MNEMRRDPVTRKWILIDKDAKVEKAIEELRSAVSKEREKLGD